MSQWYVLRLKPQTEMSTDQALRHIGFETMCPYAKGQKYVRGARRDWKWPLFTGYLFAAWRPFGAGWERLTNDLDGIRSIRGILKREDGEPCVLSPEDAAYIASISFGRYTSPEELRSLRVGDQVLIPDGPFEGYLAMLKNISGKMATLEPISVKIKYPIRIALAKLRKV